MGEMSYLIPLLSRKDDPAVRRGALAAIRSYTALGPEASGKVREQLAEEFGEDKASLAGQMIVGFSPQEAASSQLISTLVGLLSPMEQSVGVRELAFDTLMRLTARTDAWDMIPISRRRGIRPGLNWSARGSFGPRRRPKPRRNDPPVHSVEDAVRMCYSLPCRNRRSGRQILPQTSKAATTDSKAFRKRGAYRMMQLF